MSSGDLGPLDLIATLRAARERVGEALGRDTTALLLGSDGPTVVAAAEGVPTVLIEALAGPSGAALLRALVRSPQPVRLTRSTLPTAAEPLGLAMKSIDAGALVAFPLLAERGVVGFVAAAYDAEDDLPLTEPEGWRTACRAVQTVQLAAATSALALALAHERRRPAQLCDGVVVVDIHDRVVFADGLFQKLDGWETSGPLGRELASLPGGDVLAEVALADSPRSTWQEHRLVLGQGRTTPVAAVALPLVDGAGREQGGRVVLARDLRLDRESPLDATGRMLALAMRVGHVTDQVGHALPQEDDDADPLESFARVAVGEARAAVAMAVEACVPREDRSVIEVNELLLQELDRYREELGAEGVKLFTFFRPELPPVPGDPLHLLRAVRILVEDARTSLRRRGGALTARTWADDTWVYGAVSDDGTGGDGPSPGMGEPLFQAADKVDETGLAAVRDIVERMGGRLLVERRPRVWNRVTVMLRQERRATPRPVTPSPAGRGTERTARLCVLVVDDNAALRSVLRRYLERRGHAVTEANDGLEGLELVQSQAFDRLIVDIQMPNKDGTEFYEDLETVDPAMRGRTIFVTGGFLTETVERFIRESGRPSVKKPFDLAEMARTVES